MWCTRCKRRRTALRTPACVTSLVFRAQTRTELLQVGRGDLGSVRHANCSNIAVATPHTQIRATPRRQHRPNNQNHRFPRGCRLFQTARLPTVTESRGAVAPAPQRCRHHRAPSMTFRHGSDGSCYAFFLGALFITNRVVTAAKRPQSRQEGKKASEEKKTTRKGSARSAEKKAADVSSVAEARGTCAC